MNLTVDVDGTFMTKYPTQILGVMASNKKIPLFFNKLGQMYDADAYWTWIILHGHSTGLPELYSYSFILINLFLHNK